MLITIAQFVLSLSLLVVLHEMGHFFPAIWFKTRVEKFYLFFDPWFSVLKFKRGDTEYGIGWLPLGGYVKISGMVDESMDTEALKEEPKPWEFRSKPAWQRLIIMMGGVTVNFILGLLIFTGIALYWGNDYIKPENLKNGLGFDETTEAMGFKDGDIITAVDDLKLQNYADWRKELVFSDMYKLNVLRDGQDKVVQLKKEDISYLVSSKFSGVTERIPMVIDSMMWNSPNKTILMPGDKIIGYNDERFEFLDQSMQVREKFIAANLAQKMPALVSLPNTMTKYSSDKILVTVVRKSDTLSLLCTLDSTNHSIMSHLNLDLKKIFKVDHESYGLGGAIAKGWDETKDKLGMQVKQFGLMFNGTVKATESLGGFASIASMFGTTWDWKSFWNMTALLSIVLAFMNLLPIPALDGGHVMFLLYEVVSGKAPSDKFLEHAQTVGFFIVIGLILFSNGLDIYRWFLNNFM